MHKVAQHQKHEAIINWSKFQHIQVKFQCHTLKEYFDILGPGVSAKTAAQELLFLRVDK